MTRSVPVLLIVALLSCTGCESYNVHRFRSDDAVIMYCGFWSTPRYIIPFEEIVVSQAETVTTYEFTNPPDNVGLWVGLNFSEPEDLDALIAVQARATSIVVDASGQKILEFTGPLVADMRPRSGQWHPHAYVAMVPPTNDRFRGLGQVLRQSQIAKDGIPTPEKWGFNRRSDVLMAWGAWIDFKKGSYTIQFTIETATPPARPVRILPLLIGGSRGVL